MVLKENQNEFIEDGKTVKAIDDNSLIAQISGAVDKIVADF